MKVFCDLSGKRRLGTVITNNHHTIWVRVMMGAKSYIDIERHKVKHNVVFEFGDYNYVPNTISRINI